MSLTKTDFMRGMQCPRMLWLDKHHPSWKRIPPETQKRLDLGNEFGDKAMAMFGPYVEMTVLIPGKQYPDKEKMVQNTKRHLEIGTENICEAAFEWHGHYCAVDILHKTIDGYEMYEVKNAPEVKEQFIRDAGFQTYILEKAGTKPQKVFIVYHGDDEENPFVPVEITEQALAFSEIVASNLDRLDAVKMQCAEVYAEPGEQCDNPYECWYKHVCVKDQLSMFSKK